MKTGDPRRLPNLDWEVRLGYPAIQVAGVDEVGRGCLAGPVVAGAIVLPAVVDYKKHPWLGEIADSKLVKPEMREILAPLIEAWAPATGIGVASVEEIDRINIFHASHLAMRRAIEALSLKSALGAALPDAVLVDGKFLPKDLPCRAQAVIKGDLQCLSIAAASILAKVWRDRKMAELDSEFPGYGLAVHKGYSTPQHSRALINLGPCRVHRRSFAPVSKLLAGRTV